MTESVGEQLQPQKYILEGLHCANCAAKIEDTLKREGMET